MEIKVEDYEAKINISVKCPYCHAGYMEFFTDDTPWIEDFNLLVAELKCPHCQSTVSFHVRLEVRP